MSRQETQLAAIFGAIFVVLAVLPFVVSGVWLSLAVEITMYAVLATSWTLFSGPTHYISLATAAFFGLGM